MAKKQEQRLKTEIESTDAGDIVRLIDTKTGEVVNEEFRGVDATVAVPLTSAPETTAREKKPINAQEMLRLALTERQESYGRRVRDLVNAVLAKCVEVVLTGNLRYDLEEEVPAEIVKGAVAELKGLGYKVQKIANPKAAGGATIFVKWQTELKMPKAKKKSRLIGVDTETTSVEPEASEPKVPGVKTHLLPEEDMGDMSFVPMKGVKISGRPKRRFPKPDKKKEVLPQKKEEK